MTDLICNYCENKFKTISSLNLHQKNTKYCLIIQGKINIKEQKDKEFKCEYCNKILASKQNLQNHTKKCEIIEEQIEFICNYCDKILCSKKNLSTHYNTCLEKKNTDIDILIKEKDKEMKEKEKLIIQNQNYIKQIEKQEEQIKILQQTIEKMSLRAIDKPTTTNNTTNNILNLTSSIDFKDISKIKDIIEDSFNINYAVSGQKGLARFVVEKFLTDENGKLNYICTDPSRQIFKYKDNTGEIKKDVEAKKLTNYIVDAGIKKKTVDVSNEWYTNDNGDIDMTKFNIMMEQQQSILKLKDDNNSFKKELVTITTN